MNTTTATVPLCVDLDHSLVEVNTLEETLIGAVRKNPVLIFLIPFWALRGQAYLWARLITKFRPSPALLPYSQPVMALVRDEVAAGREVWLSTGAHLDLAQDVSDHLGFFAGVVATGNEEHMVGEKKARALVARFGAKGFDYVGDSQTDLPVFRSCRQAHVVSPSKMLANRLQAESIPHRWIRQKPRQSSELIRAMRPRQWVKNLLVFVPALLGHRISDPEAAWNSAFAFVLLCLASSAVYLLNDIIDMEADRLHHVKRMRPFARGAVMPRVGLVAAASLAITAAGWGWRQTPMLSLMLMSYIVCTALYSFWLKQLLIVDMILLASFYAARVFIGSEATGIPVSKWTALFCLLVFFGLAAVKRCAEIRNRAASASISNNRRAYVLEDAVPLMSMGMASMVGAVITIGLYLGSADVKGLYRTPGLLWLACPILLAWTGRVWMLTHRGVLVDEDPVAFALRDTWSYGALTLMGIIFLLAL
ncbi:MAG: UbiA family prenyltransferase [Acidobacteria bacterium]|nr:UbiA family prenyltransferase [Acidobacteriota bacterium]